MVRYLLYFGYIGTGFHGVQKQSKNFVADLGSIQGIIEAALQRLKAKNWPYINTSSRTDAGVHALCTTGDVEIIHPEPALQYQPIYITSALNKFFSDNEYSIKIHKTVVVPDDFSARHNAVARTYLYRLAVFNESIPADDGRDLFIMKHLPVIELNRCCAVYAPFDFDKVKQAALYLPGKHDFTTFTGHGSARSPIRELLSASVTPGSGLMAKLYDPLYENIDFWDFKFTGRSYSYNQIRRMVGALLGVGSGYMEPDYVKYMLEHPCTSSWPDDIRTAPSQGLYLVNVQYPDDLTQCNKNNENAEDTDDDESDSNT